MSSYFYAAVDDVRATGVVRSGSNNTLGWDEQSCDADGIAAECGRLFAIELPAGDYVFKAVQVNNLASSPAIYAAEAYSLPLPDYRFTVVAGEVRYLGNLHSRICIGAANAYGNLAVWAARGEVRDAYTRDWPLLMQKYPVLAKLPAAKAVLTAAPWLWKRPKPAPAEQWPTECGPYIQVNDT